MAYIVWRGRTDRKWATVRYVPRGGTDEIHVALHTQDPARAEAERARIEREDEEPRSRAAARRQDGLLGAFLDSRRAQGCSDETLRYYRAKFAPLLRHLAPVPMERWNRGHFDAFLNLTRPRPLSDTSRNAYRRDAKTLRSWALDAGYRMGDLVGGMKAKRPRRVRRDPLTSEQVRSLLAAATGPYRVAFALAAFAGLRLNDVRTIERKHVADGWIDKVATKNGEPIHVPIGPTLLAILKAAPVASGPLCRLPKESATRRGIARVYEAAGVPRERGDGLHRLRHWYATNIEDGRARRDLLAHRHGAVTDTYVDRATDELRVASIEALERMVGA